MPTPPLPDDVLIEALNLAEQYGSPHMAFKAGATTIHPNTLVARIQTARIRNLKPTVSKDAPRIKMRQRIGKIHLVVPDVQAKPGVNTDHLEHVGNYIVEKQPDVIVCIGDFWDMPSLSSYDKGRLSFEGRRYVQDIKAGQDAMARLMKPLEDYNRTADIKYKPEMHFCMGNHEIRISRVVDLNPEYEGKFSLDDLGLSQYGWKVHDFLTVAKIDGLEYSHYFVTSPASGRPVSSARALLNKRKVSATMGHNQITDIAMDPVTGAIGLFCGICYTHSEAYLGPQGNTTRRQIVVKHEVENGTYDPVFCSLRFLAKAYA